MNAMMLLQIFLDLCLIAGLVIVIKKVFQAPKEDPRLSKGLQLLQSKIAVLEDLSDRVDHQASQSSQLIDQKIKDIQKQLNELEKEMQKVEVSRQKSLEVARIFQDKIPHQEIIERQNTIKYVQAARLAHQGKAIDEIAKVVDLPIGELEFIIKVNRKELQFAEDSLPEWAGGEQAPQSAAPSTPAAPTLKDLGDKFRAAIG